jgi:O-antigen ligase/tetratricopeptide (TPR) repeat protein
MIRIGPARLSRGELVALVAGLLVFAYLAWDQALWDPRFQAPLHVIAGGAVVAAGVLAWRGSPVPRTSLEIPVLALLATLGLATLTSQNPGLSARSLVASITWALLLPVGLVVVRRRPAIAASAATIPILALALSTLVEMVGRRVAWVAADGPGLPPVRLPGESTPFGSVAVAPFVLSACLVLTLLVASPAVRRGLQAALVAVGIPLTYLSGSRSAWLAFGVAAVVLGVAAWRRMGVRIRLPRGPREIGVAMMALVVLVLGTAFAAPRLTAMTSILYREGLWGDTLRAWSANPILGVGPGVMPYARQAAAQPGTFPAVQPHSHNLALGLLGDAGILGLAAGILLVATFLWIAGPHRSATARGRFASSMVVGYLAAGLFEDLTFLPGFDLLLLLLVAIALEDAGAVRWEPLWTRRDERVRTGRSRIPRPVPLLAVVLASVAIGIPAAFGDAAAIVYRIASDRAWARDWTSAASLYRAAETLDPSHPAAPKALTVAADNAGDRQTALASAHLAVALNPGDDDAWTNLALLCRSSGDTACAARAARKAVDYAPTGGSQLINAAMVFESLGDHASADGAYRLSELVNLNTTLGPAWPRRVDPGTVVPAGMDTTTGELNLLVARATLGDSVDPNQFTAPAVQALAYAIEGNRHDALGRLAAARSAAPDDALTWDMTILLERHWGEDFSYAEAVDRALRGGPLATAPQQPARLVWDVASFRPFPADGLVSSARRLLAASPWPSTLEGLLPAP